MSILHHRRNVKRRAAARGEGERQPQPFEFERASVRAEQPGTAVLDPAARPAAPARIRRKAKAKRKARA